MISCVGLELAPADSVATIGYWLGKPYWRRGYTSEACRAVVRWAHDIGFARLVATCLADNAASVQLLHKLGLAEEGHLRRHIRREGRRQDLLWFGEETQTLVAGL